MPDVRNCRRCGKVFNYIGGMPICTTCRELDEVDFKRVKEYLYDHPGATITEVSNALEISVKRIKGYLKEGRLEIVGDGSNMVLECEKCGKSIRSGQFCDACSRGLADDLKSTATKISDDMHSKEEADTRSIGMRYLNKDHRK